MMAALLGAVLAAPAIRGAWIATVDHVDWPPKGVYDVAKQQAALVALLERCHKANLTDLFFQVRPAGDALYESSVEPWSEYLTGRQGKPPATAWDPLNELTERARQLGIRIHAWINPFRAKHPSAPGPLSPRHLALERSASAVPYGKLLWFDPSLPEVQDRAIDVAVDLVMRYRISGIHIDDYFYPYPVNGAPFPDGPSFERYRHGGGKLGLLAWRRGNIDRFVQRLHLSVKRARKDCVISISPFGIYRPGVPSGTHADLDAFNDLAADPIKWAKNGWCDLLIPQLYWPDGGKQSFSKLLDWWRASVPKDVQLAAGLYTSKRSAAEIAKQIQLVSSKPGVAGYVHFSSKAVTVP